MIGGAACDLMRERCHTCDCPAICIHIWVPLTLLDKSKKARIIFKFSPIIRYGEVQVVIRISNICGDWDNMGYNGVSSDLSIISRQSLHAWWCSTRRLSPTLTQCLTGRLHFIVSAWAQPIVPWFGASNMCDSGTQTQYPTQPRQCRNRTLFRRWDWFG